MKKSILILVFAALCSGLYSQNMLDALLGYWKHDETTGVVTNDEMNNYDGDINSATINQAGKFGQAILFDESDDYIDFTGDAGTTFNNFDFTFAAWVYRHDNDAWNEVIGGDPNCAGLVIDDSGNPRLRKWYVNTGVAPSLTVTSNQWVHVAVTFDASETTNNVVFYVDGSAETESYDYDFTGVTRYIGAAYTGSYFTNHFDGLIDEVCIYDRKLTAGEIATLMEDTYPFTGEEIAPAASADINKVLYMTYHGMVHNPPVNIPEEDIDMTEIAFYDFESEIVGQWDYDEIDAYFDPLFLYTHGYLEYIVNDEINGDATKVFRITHEAGELSSGFEAGVPLGAKYEQVFLSYNYKVDKEFCSTAGGKMPGLGGYPRDCDPCSDPDCGFLDYTMFKYAGFPIAYRYDRDGCPWAENNPFDDFPYNTVTFVNGVWYNIARLIKVNTITDGKPDANGIDRLWVDGKLIVDNHTLIMRESEDVGIDYMRLAHFYGGGDPFYDWEYIPLYETYGYIDNVYLGVDNKIEDLTTLLPIHTPNEVENYDYPYDTQIDVPYSGYEFHNSEYNGAWNYSGQIDETYLLTVPAGNTITYTFDAGIGSYDWLFIYDGADKDAPLLYTLTDGSANDVEITTTGNKMYIRLSADRNGYEGLGYTGTITY